MPCADGHLTGPVTPSPLSPLQRVLIWTVLFIVSSAFHAAETSITTLYPWKVRITAARTWMEHPWRLCRPRPITITAVFTVITIVDRSLRASLR